MMKVWFIVANKQEHSNDWLKYPVKSLNVRSCHLTEFQSDFDTVSGAESTIHIELSNSRVHRPRLLIFQHGRGISVDYISALDWALCYNEACDVEKQDLLSPKISWCPSFWLLAWESMWDMIIRVTGKSVDEYDWWIALHMYWYLSHLIAMLFCSLTGSVPSVSLSRLVAIVSKT